jgi:hypothetical protein
MNAYGIVVVLHNRVTALDPRIVLCPSRHRMMRNRNSWLHFALAIFSARDHNAAPSLGLGFGLLSRPARHALRVSCSAKRRMHA